jgi:bifunctional polynucleotide phosphatase/kinase
MEAAGEEEEETPEPLPTPEITDKYVVYPATKYPVVKNADGNMNLLLFDVDGTLITSKSGRPWAKDANDWIFLGNVPDVLNEFKKAGWMIALISNQSNWSKKTEEVKGKFESILAAIQKAHGWTPWLLLATGAKDTVYRKPGRGLYDLLLTKLGLTEENIGDKRMVGDAADVEDPEERKTLFAAYRWANSDRKFAEAIGADFMLPNNSVYFGKSKSIKVSEAQELVLLMGNPGSGKSTTAKTLEEQGYIHVEQDKTKTKEKTMKAVKAALEEGDSVIVDATHASEENRKLYEDLAEEKGIPFRILWHIRDGREFNKLRAKPIADIAYATYTSNFVEPEGDNVELVY